MKNSKFGRLVAKHWPIPSPVSLRPLGGHRLWIKFSDEAEGVLDMTSDVAERRSHPLRDPSVFAQAAIGEDIRMPDENLKDDMHQTMLWVIFASAGDVDVPFEDYAPVDALVRTDGTRPWDGLLWWDVWNKWPYSYDFSPDSLYLRVVYNEGQPLPEAWFQEDAA